MARLEDRVTDVERRLDLEVRLNASRDQDLSDLVVIVRSHTTMLEALQEGQAKHSAILAKHSAILAEHSEALASLNQKVGSLDQKVGSLDQKVGSLDQRVGSLEHAVGSLREMTVAGFAAIGGQLQLLIDRDEEPR